MTRKPKVPTDIEIARASTVSPITEIAERIGLEPDDLIPFGRTRRK